MSPLLLAPLLVSIATTASSPTAASSDLASALVPSPQRIQLHEGSLPLGNAHVTVHVPGGPEHEACRAILREALQAAGATVQVRTTAANGPNQFTLQAGCDLPPLPKQGFAEEAYVLAVGSQGASAAASSATGLLYAAQTLRQLVRLGAAKGRLPAVTIADYPEFKLRGIYIEGGQERFGRVVDKDYLCQQIRRLAEFKMNTLVVECYNLFPFPSFPACADSGTLASKDCDEIVAEARRFHVTLIPSLQTLAQAYELVWTCDAGKPYRETTAPGQMCPSAPEIYPLIKGLYRDLLTRFDTSPLIGIGCSEIDMQWQRRYCLQCQKRIAAGQTVRDLLLGHAEKCVQAVEELAAELKRPIRPLMWADEFYMYGPGKDWVGMDHISKNTVMGYWKYWSDYQGIGGLMARGYDVLGISAMYNHTFYLADLSPQSPRKSWPPMQETGTRNIAQLMQEAAKDRQAYPKVQFWGTATASFSKHRLRAFDSIWYGFVLNGQCNWSRPDRSVEDYQTAFTRAFVEHYYDCRSDKAAETLAAAWQRLDACKSQLELANQTLHDVVGVYDTQEAGYQGNTLLGAWHNCRQRIAPSGQPDETLARIRAAAIDVQKVVSEVQQSLQSQRKSVANQPELDDLVLAAEKIDAHAEREVLMIDSQAFLVRAPGLSTAEQHQQATDHAKRWTRHRARVQAIAQRDSRLYRQGDPCGHAAVLRDIDAIQAHFATLAREQSSRETSQILLDEPFKKLDPARWLLLGQPRLANGHLETSVSGGWENRCGIATRQPLPLELNRPLVVEFTLTPIKMGIDSQVFASATETGIDSYRFSFYGPNDRFGIYTQSAKPLSGGWLDPSPGWRQRAQSAPIKPATEYRVRAEIRRTSFRVVVHPSKDSAWDLPFWDSGPVPMDSLDQARLRWADVEPEGRAGATRWGPIRIAR